jgi:hypothetical protein
MEEAAKFGSALIVDRQSGITNELRKMLEAGFFIQPRKFGDIKSELQSRGVSVKPSSLHEILTRMVERKEIRRTGPKRLYKYCQAVDPLNDFHPSHPSEAQGTL